MEATDLTDLDIKSPPFSTAGIKEQIELFATSSSTQSPEIAFDVILEHIGFGMYHYKPFVILELLGIADGSSSLVISFILPLFKKNLVLKFDLQAILGTCIYLGCLFGSLSSGYFADRYGRRRPILYSSLVMFILGALCSYPSNFLFFILIQTIFGIVGLFSYLAHTIMAEITPLKYRGKYMVLLGINHVIGQLLCVIIAILTLDSLESGNWGILMLCSISVPAFLAWIAALFFLNESAHHETALGNYNKSIDILREMYAEDQGQPKRKLMTKQEEKQLIQTFKASKENISASKDGDNSIVQFPLLFTGLLKRMTSFVWLNWSTNSLTFFGITYILPTTYLFLHKQQAVVDQKQSVSDLIYPVLMELPSMFVAASIVDLKRFGRKNSLAGTFLLGGFFCILPYC